MPIQSRINQYRGVNAHLHSYLQANVDSWTHFHTSYITLLVFAIGASLPIGYRVEIERSLQIRENYREIEDQIRRLSPVRAYTKFVLPSSRNAVDPPQIAVIIQPLRDTIINDESLYHTAAVIYRSETNKSLGKPVIQFELLSPANKDGDGYWQYVDKRRTTLKSGLTLVEIDYLHETVSPIRGIPCYIYKQPTSRPYSVTINHPQPSFEKGISTTYLFHVDDPIPALSVPLEGNDRIQVDFGIVYSQVYSKLHTDGYRVDYEQLPLRFETYMEIDQERIRRRMDAVSVAHRQGVDLDAAPVPLQP